MKNERGSGSRKPRFSNRGPRKNGTPHREQRQSRLGTAAAPVKDAATELTLKGILSVNSRGVGYFPIEGREEDIEIENEFLKNALNGDEVEIVLHPKASGRRDQGEVVRIITRAKTEFVGTVKTAGSSTFVIPDDKKMYVDIYIPPQDAKRLTNGTKVLVRIESWNEREKNPVGRVLKELGRKGDHEAEMQSIILERGIVQDFPPEVEREAETLKREAHPIPRQEIESRRDFRDITTFTIDPADAKDFDDALSIRKIGDGRFEIGVHIADVSHYVKDGTALDREARKRGFSVYLVDRTIPMLPEVLSNDLASLNPGEEKLSFSAVFEMDDRGRVSGRWFGKTVIRSDKRFSYEEAQGVLDASEPGNDAPFRWELSTLNKIAKKLSEDRYKKGAIDFDTVEVKFKLDPNGKPIEVYQKPRLDTHKLIEEFMLLANREVAEHIFRMDEKNRPAPGEASRRPFIYRIHDFPDKDRLAELSIFISALGYKLGREGKDVTPSDIARLLDDIAGASQESLIKTATIRSMAKAVYSTKNIGHFGLAFRYYTHFTSPIRRYSDLIVHRLLFKYLKNPKAVYNDFVKYEKIALETSQKEVKAAEAERASIKYKQVEFLKDRVGETFDGIISGVTEWGVYVEEAHSRAEGMVRVRDMGNDYFTLDKKTYSLVGERTGTRYTLGDKVKVKLVAADMDKKNLDFVFA